MEKIIFFYVQSVLNFYGTLTLFKRKGMMLKVNQETSGNAWDGCLDIAAFAGVGYLSGKVINEYVKWTSTPSIFKKTITIDLMSSAYCCGLFAAIDRLSYAILRSQIGYKRANKPVYSALRIGGCAVGSIWVFNKIAFLANLKVLEEKPAVAVILTAIVIYNLISSQLALFNSRE